MDCENFATERRPLRASELPVFLTCPMSLLLRDALEPSSGVAADTGSAVHYAAKIWHTVAKGKYSDALDAMMGNAEEYPFADMSRAEEIFRRYANDERNQKAKIVFCEEKIEIRAAADPSDKTQKEILIRGTVDQVRVINGEYWVWDIKTGKRLFGPEMLDAHAAQLAAYWVGAAVALGKPISGCGVIRTEDYFTRKRGHVFWESPLGPQDVLTLIQSVARVVAAVRNRSFWVNPGELCKWCVPGKTAECLPKYRGLTIVA